MECMTQEVQMYFNKPRYKNFTLYNKIKYLVQNLNQVFVVLGSNKVYHAYVMGRKIP